MLIGLKQILIEDKWREGSSGLRRKNEENCHGCEGRTSDRLDNAYAVSSGLELM